MVITKCNKSASLSKSLKINLSSNCSLQVENMKAESLVIAEKNVAVNIFSIFVHTARHAMGIGMVRNNVVCCFEFIKRLIFHKFLQIS